MLKKIISFVLSVTLITSQPVFAQGVAQINLGNYLRTVGSSMAMDKFRPLHMRYFSYDMATDNFQLLLDKGDNKDIKEGELEEKTKVLMDYFKIGLSLPNEKFWVNLRPDAQDQIIDPELEKTDIGKIMLEADLQLKKDTAGLTSPQNPEGKAYWDKLYKKAGELFGSENITIPTITRPWIVPGEIILRQREDSAYIFKANMKVLLEEDYLSSQPSAISSQQYNFKDPRMKELNQYSTQLIRELIIPRLTKEVNISKRYAPLRQVFFSLVMARWFKDTFGSSGSASAPGIRVSENSYVKLIDSGDLTNLTSKDSWFKTYYFNEYKKSFEKGEYNLKEDIYTPTGQVIRSYVSGGVSSAIMTQKPTGTIEGNGLVPMGASSIAVTGTAGSSSLSAYKDIPARELLRGIFNSLQAKKDGVGSRTPLADKKGGELFVEFERREDALDAMLNAFDTGLVAEYDNITWFPVITSIINISSANSFDVSKLEKAKLVIQRINSISISDLSYITSGVSGMIEILLKKAKNASLANNQEKKNVKYLGESSALPKLNGSELFRENLQNGIRIRLLPWDALEDILPGKSKVVIKKLIANGQLYGKEDGGALIYKLPFSDSYSDNENAIYRGIDYANPYTSASELKLTVSIADKDGKTVTISIEEEKLIFERLKTIIQLNKTIEFGRFYNVDTSSVSGLIKSLEISSWANPSEAMEALALWGKDAIRELVETLNNTSDEKKNYYILGALKRIASKNPVAMNTHVKDIIVFLDKMLNDYYNKQIEKDVRARRFPYHIREVLGILSKVDVRQEDVGFIKKIYGYPITSSDRRLVDELLRHKQRNEKGEVSSSMEIADIAFDKTGGIDFRQMNYLVQPMGSFKDLQFGLPTLSSSVLEKINLDVELEKLRDMVKNGMVPSGMRVKEYLAACFQKGKIEEKQDDLLVCLAEIYRLAEEENLETSPELRESLVIVDTGKFVLLPNNQKVGLN